MTRPKVICFGGSFNPPHKDHLKVALAAKKALRAHEVWFIPAVQSPLKDIDLAPFEQRVQMVEALIAAYRHLHVCRIEATLELPNYTLRSVEALQKQHPDLDFVWLIGSDQAQKFDQWHQADRLRTLLPFAVYRRHPQDVIPQGFIELEGVDLLQASSEAVRQGQVAYCPPSVLRKMVEFELYLEPIARSMVSPKRWTHVQQMTQLALELGSAHGLDLHVIYVAALFHDCTKAWPLPKSEAWMRTLYPKLMGLPHEIWHPYTGEAWLKRHLHIIDPRILKAVRHHVGGHFSDPYSQVIYLADKLDPSRGYDSRELIMMAMKDLDQAMLQAKAQQRDYLKQAGKTS